MPLLAGALICVFMASLCKSLISPVQKSDLWIMQAATVKPVRTTNIQNSLATLSVVAM